ncbi:MAG TPA: hypothetical protein VMV79_02355 [Alphaproteobacteria bacterium]|nr:hypothetical protein [Alphaproteobacteria bacterium]
MTETLTDLDRGLARLAFVNGMTSLARLEPEAGEMEELGDGESRRKKGRGGKGRFGSGGTSAVSLWSMIAGWMTGRGDKGPMVLGLTQPSDGHPQEEMVPDFAWFRPLAHNNQTWVLYWPELTV